MTDGLTDDEIADVLGQSRDDPGTRVPEPEPAHPVGELPATVIVVGSFHWDTPGAVIDQLEAWRKSRTHGPVLLITSGCPEGAERTAREYAAANGWHHSGLRDEELIQLPQAIAFLFIRDDSAGATRALEIIQRAKIWHRVTRDTTMRITSPWADR